MSSLQETLRRTIKGEVLFDAASRGRYSTDASIYQIEPVGVVVPRDETDLALVVDVARDAKAAILPRGAGTSQCGQTVGEALVVDVSKYLREVVGFNKERAEVTVQPGVVLVPGQRPIGEAVSGTINMLCSDRYTDMGEGATYQSTYLDVSPWKDSSASGKI